MAKNKEENQNTETSENKEKIDLEEQKELKKSEDTLEKEKKSEKVEPDFEDLYYRSQAEIKNIQQRTAKELATFRKYDGQKLAESLLASIDNLERALEVEADDDAAKQLKTGVDMTYKGLVGSFAENGITSFGEVGEKFNPEMHQAIQNTQASKEAPKDTIAQVLQKGYKLSDRVIRPAMVVVSQ